MGLAKPVAVVQLLVGGKLGTLHGLPTGVGVNAFVLGLLDASGRHGLGADPVLVAAGVIVGADDVGLEVGADEAFVVPLMHHGHQCPVVVGHAADLHLTVHDAGVAGAAHVEHGVVSAEAVAGGALTHAVDEEGEELAVVVLVVAHVDLEGGHDLVVLIPGHDISGAAQAQGVHPVLPDAVTHGGHRGHDQAVEGDQVALLVEQGVQALGVRLAPLMDLIHEAGHQIPLVPQVGEIALVQGCLDGAAVHIVALVDDVVQVVGCDEHGEVLLPVGGVHQVILDMDAGPLGHLLPGLDGIHAAFGQILGGVDGRPPGEGGVVVADGTVIHPLLQRPSVRVGGVTLGKMVGSFVLFGGSLGLRRRRLGLRRRCLGLRRRCLGRGGFAAAAALAAAGKQRQHQKRSQYQGHSLLGLHSFPPLLTGGSFFSRFPLKYEGIIAQCF